jgi:hypothetical protein
MSTPADKDPRLPAAVDLLRRTGAREVQIRYSDDKEPTVWLVVVKWGVDSETGKPIPEAEGDGEFRHDAAAAMTPLAAAFRLCERVLAGSYCVYCNRPAMFSGESLVPVVAAGTCWYLWDGERKAFRRDCEGVAQAPGRNDPC